MKRLLLIPGLLVVVLAAAAAIARAEPSRAREAGRDAMLRLAFAAVADRVAPSVVEVLGETRGFGVAISSDGEVLTCNRLLAPAATAGSVVKLKLQDGRELVARVVGRHGPLDVALLLVGEGTTGKRELPAGLTAVRQGDSRTVAAGDLVLSSGAAGYLCAGMVGATGREIGRERRIPTQGVFGVFGAPNLSPLRPYPEVIQHDSSFEAGWFGAPLVDREGRLIGINIAAFYRGSVYATPLHRIQEAIDVLRKGGHIAPPLSYAPAGPSPDDILEHLDEAIDRMLDEEDSPLRKLLLEIFDGGPEHPVRKALEERSRKKGDGNKEHGFAPGHRCAASVALLLAPWATAPEDKAGGGWLGIRAGRVIMNAGYSGALVKKVYAGSPAENAGLKDGDIIVAIDGEPIESVANLANRLRESGPGTKVALEIRRLVLPPTNEGIAPNTEESLVISVVLGIRQEETAPGFLGVGLTDGTEGPRVGYVLPNGPAAKAGILRGDEILNVERSRTHDLATFEKAMARKHAGSRLRLTLLRDGQKLKVEVVLGKRE